MQISEMVYHIFMFIILLEMVLYRRRALHINPHKHFFCKDIKPFHFLHTFYFLFCLMNIWICGV